MIFGPPTKPVKPKPKEKLKAPKPDKQKSLRETNPLVEIKSMLNFDPVKENQDVLTGSSDISI